MLVYFEVNPTVYAAQFAGPPGVATRHLMEQQCRSASPQSVHRLSKLGAAAIERELHHAWAHFRLWKRTTRLFFYFFLKVKLSDRPESPGLTIPVKQAKTRGKAPGALVYLNLAAQNVALFCFLVSTFIAIVTDSRSWPVAIETAAAATVKAVPKLGPITILLFCRF